MEVRTNGLLGGNLVKVRRSHSYSTRKCVDVVLKVRVKGVPGDAPLCRQRFNSETYRGRRHLDTATIQPKSVGTTKQTPHFLGVL